MNKNHKFRHEKKIMKTRPEYPNNTNVKHEFNIIIAFIYKKIIYIYYVTITFN